MALPANTVWRDYDVANVPASGPHRPVKRDIREWASALEGALTGVSAIFSTLAQANANLQYESFSIAWIVQDTPSINGVYQKQGASDTGVWVKLLNLPYSFERGTNAGAGSGNDIQVTTARPVSSDTLVTFNITTANTNPNVTVSFNGLGSYALRTASSSAPSVGSLTPNMLLAGYIDGAVFRLLSDTASDPVLAGAEAFSYIFDGTTAQTDPGVGRIRLNASTQSEATRITIDDTTANNVNVSTIINSFDDSTSVVKGTIRIVAVANPARFIQYSFTTVTDPTSYKTVTVSFIGPGNALLSNQLFNNEKVTVVVSRAGDLGGQGVQGVTGAQGIPGLTNYQGVWSSAPTYALGHTVNRGSGYFISQQASNANHDPATDTANTWWAPIMVHRPTVTIGRMGTRGQYFADYLCTGTNDHTVINNAAIALSAAGGGTLKILAGSYSISGEVHLYALSNIVLEGEGKRATKLVKSASFGGAGVGIRVRACTGVHVRDISVISGSQGGNGIEFVPDSQTTYTGTPCRDVSVANCHVELKPDSHVYGIWFFKADGFFATGNFVDGKSTNLNSVQGQVGIETYSGKNGRVFGNHVQNMSGSAYDIINSLNLDYEGGVENVTYFGNTADKCTWGILTTAVNDPVYGPGHMRNVSMRNNVLKRIFKIGVRIEVTYGNASDPQHLWNFDVSDNLVQMATIDDGASPTDVTPLLITNQGTYVSGTDVVSIKNASVRGNKFMCCPDATGAAMATIFGVERFLIEDNDFERPSATTSNIGALILNSPDTIFRNNRLTRSGAIMIDARDSDRVKITGNEMSGCNQVGVGPALIVANTPCSHLEISGNRFDRVLTTNLSSFVRFGANVDHFLVEDNRSLEAFAIPEFIDGAIATLGNRGRFTRSGGLLAVQVDTSRCGSDSLIRLNQRSGGYSNITSIVANNNYFVVNFDTADLPLHFSST